MLNRVRITSWYDNTPFNDIGFEIRAVAVCGRARYLSVTGAPQNIESLRVSGKETYQIDQ